MKPWARRTTLGTGLAGLVMAVLIAVDQLGNALTGGDPDMTISTRCGLKAQAGEAGPACRAICWTLDWIDPDHCAEARE